MTLFRFIQSCLFTAISVSLVSCNKSNEPALKVAASSVPHAEILEFVKPQLKEDHIDLDIILVDDYQTPNRALADKEVDANFFQHLPFLDAQIQDFGYALQSLTPVHIEPMGIYSKSVQDLTQLQPGSTVALPNDPSNQARALALLQKAGFLTLSDKGKHSSLLDIVENPLQLKFIEMDAPLLGRALEEVNAAVINANVALLSGLSPEKDALVLEDKNSKYVNIVVIRQGDETREDLQALKKALTTEKTRQFILDHFKGALTPAF